jgi:hypothetical protein
MVTVVPTPRSLATLIDPPFNSTLRFAMVNPGLFLSPCRE